MDLMKWMVIGIVLGFVVGCMFCLWTSKPTQPKRDNEGEGE